MGTKTLTECRSTFKNFFAKNSHQIVDSSPLVPQNDPTLSDHSENIPEEKEDIKEDN